MLTALFHLKDTLVLVVNVYSSQMDPEMWVDLENFRPERFLDPAANIVNEHKFLTFSIGNNLGSPDGCFSNVVEVSV